MRKTTGYRARCLAVLTVLALTAVSQAADLHFIVFAETQDPTIGTAHDLDNAAGWARTIEGYTGLNLRLQTLSGQDLTTDNARRMLQTLKPAADDVVYFVYSGHGVNAGDSRWPTFAFISYSGEPYLDLDEVFSTLQPKPQRLLIVLADCCNAYFDSGRPSPGLDASAQSALTAANFQNLFLNFRGTVLASSSSAGQYSLGESSSGGLFLNTYMEDFLDLAGGTPSLTWEKVLSTTTGDVRATAAYYISDGALGDLEPQEPQFVISTEQVAADPPPGPDGSSNDPSAPEDPGNAAPAAPQCGPMSGLPLAAGVFLWLMHLLTNRRGRSCEL